MTLETIEDELSPEEIVMTWKEEFLLKEYKINLKTYKKTKSFRDIASINGKTYIIQNNAVYELCRGKGSKK